MSNNSSKQLMESGYIFADRQLGPTQLKLYRENIDNFKSIFTPHLTLDPVGKFRGESFVLCEVDCKQLEVSGLAEITRDKVLLDELNRGVDIHLENAALWKKKPTSQISDPVRRQAKTMTFQLQYGSSSKGMAQTLNIPMSEAADFIQAFLIKYTGVAKYFENLSFLASSSATNIEPSDKIYLLDPKNAGGTNPFGTLYPVGIYESYGGQWKPSLTQMKNYPIQGFATGDLIPYIRCLLQNFLDEIDAQDQGIYYLTTVHDSFVFQFPESSLVTFLSCVEHTFRNLKNNFFNTHGQALLAPYDYGIEIGFNWSEMVKYDRKQVQQLTGIGP